MANTDERSDIHTVKHPSKIKLVNQSELLYNYYLFHIYVRVMNELSIFSLILEYSYFFILLCETFIAYYHYANM